MLPHRGGVVQEFGMTEPLSTLDTLASLPEASAATRTAKALYRAALGPVNAGYYLALFERFDASGRAGLVWNSAAGFGSLGWLVFRRLWGMAAWYFAVLVAVLLAGVLLSAHFASWPTGVRTGLVVSLILLAVVAPGLLGNAVLHAHTRKRVVEAVAEAPTLGDACVLLANGASSWQGLKVVMVGCGMAAAALAALWSSAPGSGPSAPGLVPPSPATAAASSSSRTDDLEARSPDTEKASVPKPAETSPIESALAPVPVHPPEASASAELSPAVEVPQATVTASDAPPASGSPGDVSVKDRAPDRANEAVSAPSKAKVAPIASSAKAPAKAPVKAAAPAASKAPKQGYAINVGVFAEEANAQRVLSQLKTAQLPAYTQRVEGTKGVFTRVRVGPFSDSEQAGAAAKRIQALGLDAVVFRP